MINLNNVDRHVAPDRAPHLYSIRNQRRSMLGEAKSACTNEHLTVWKHEARNLVDHLTSLLESDEARIAAFETAVPPLEKAIALEKQATDELERAKHVYAVGSLDRKVQLGRRDDVDAAAGVFAVRTAERVSAVNVVGYLPTNAGVDQGGVRDVVQIFADVVLSRKFRGGGAITREAWARFLELTDQDLMWIPREAALTIAKAKAERERVGPDDVRREMVVMPVDDFVAELAKFKAARTAHLRQKVEAAHAALESAKAAAASLEGTVRA